MVRQLKLIVVLALVLLVGLVTFSHCADCSPSRPCLPDRPVPPETIGGLSIPFDIPIWPTMIKTEFHILPWVSLSKVSVCLPSGRSIEFRAPCLSLKPIPVWFPWLRPLDVECKDSEVCRVP
ncbi:MAG: hypothetical protein NTY51_15175 [Deltaproteobacteria bacterium]|nr:hypothetical protein [Deltaproteobacteria bacterium]